MPISTLLLVLLAADPAAASPPHATLASPDFSTVNLSADLGRFLAEDLAQRLSDSNIRVITSREIASLLGMQRQRDLLGCNEGASCIAELGNALGADGILLGDVARLGNQYRVNVKVLSPDGTKVIARDSATAESEQALLPAIQGLAGRFGPAILRAMGRAPPEPAHVEPAPLEPAPPHPGAEGLTRAALPSSSSAHPLRAQAWIPAVGAAGLAAGATVFVVLAANADHQLTSAPPSGVPLSPTDQSRVIADGERAQLIARIGYGVAAAALAAGAVMYLLPGAGGARVALAPNLSGVSLVGTWR